MSAGDGGLSGTHAPVAMIARSPFVLLACLLAGCGGGYQTTLLPTAEPNELAYQYRVEIPDGYEVRSVDYDAALVGLASGDSSGTSTSVSGRSVLSVYAVERETGDEVVFVYDDILARRTPTALILLERTAPEARAERR